MPQTSETKIKHIEAAN